MEILLSHEGYSELVREIENMQVKIAELGVYKGQEAIEQGNTWHDNFAFEQAQLEESRLNKMLQDLKDKLNNVTIIENYNNKNIVDFNNIVTIKLSFSDGRSDIITSKCSASNTPNSGEFSINSPLGRCLYMKPKGFCGEYTANNSKICVQVLDIQ